MFPIQINKTTTGNSRFVLQKLLMWTSKETNVNDSVMLYEIKNLSHGSHSSSSVFKVVVVSSGVLFPVDEPFALICSKKRTCTITLIGKRSFCTACSHASGDSFLQSNNPHTLFFSILLIPECSWNISKSRIKNYYVTKQRIWILFLPSETCR